MSRKKTPPSPETLCLPLTGADSHAHLGSEELWPRLDEVLGLARRSGVASIAQIFLRHRAYMEQKDRFKDIPSVCFVLGLHPEDLNDLEEDELELIRQDILDDMSGAGKIRAVGEIGLDYFCGAASHELQVEYFRRQLDMARKLSLPAVIHCRDAEEDCFSILESMGYKGRPLLWHCFGGGIPMAERILDNGWHVSIPGPSTYKANALTREAVKYIWNTAPDRMMFETDSPYLAPEPWRGRVNEPALSAFTGAAAADLLGVDRAEMWSRCGDNMRRFFGI